jgi:uncharacterized protein YdeI (YjbR/CyaY-like superfamily)
VSKKMAGQELHRFNREEWRAWLQDYHATQKEAWLIISKKRAAAPGLTYEEAVEEAVCFGWIDGSMRGGDGEAFTLRFSPRKSRSIWSESNKRRAKRLIEQGRMAEAGLATIREARENGEWDRATEREDTANLPPDLEVALEGHEMGRSNWNQLTSSQKRQYIYWITSARTEATRQRRVQETVRLVAENKKPGAM